MINNKTKMKKIKIELKEKTLQRAIKACQDNFKEAEDYCPIALALNSAMKVKPTSKYSAKVSNEVITYGRDNSVTIVTPKKIEKFINRFDSFMEHLVNTGKENKKMLANVRRSIGTKYTVEIPFSNRQRKKKNSSVTVDSVLNGVYIY